MTKRHKPVLVIKVGSNVDSIFIGDPQSTDCREFDRSKMSRDEKRLARRIVVDTLFPRSGR